MTPTKLSEEGNKSIEPQKPASTEVDQGPSPGEENKNDTSSSGAPDKDDLCPLNLLEEFGAKYNQLPFSIRVLLESAVRNCDNFQVLEQDVEKVLNWKETQAK